ncbi:hypothetical protein DYU11_20130 [Fibrisoma montanum]|uniref:Uncharacterized protein n=1 Tax=Fibrisoma montanum TaxID=2305895 RepID=A0A418M3L4_9BACT|nr:hypothetical protein [Fibrisoma montanum]RIV20362.1 hypothetical protein DYU11_20130 [Fibrisoma montanum]
MPQNRRRLNQREAKAWYLTQVREAITAFTATLPDGPFHAEEVATMQRVQQILLTRIGAVNEAPAQTARAKIEKRREQKQKRANSHDIHAEQNR